MKDYVELKHTIKSYDEVNDKDKCKKLKKKNYSYEKINYTNLQRRILLLTIIFRI